MFELSTFLWMLGRVLMAWNETPNERLKPAQRHEHPVTPADNQWRHWSLEQARAEVSGRDAVKVRPASALSRKRNSVDEDALRARPSVADAVEHQKNAHKKPLTFCEAWKSHGV